MIKHKLQAAISRRAPFLGKDTDAMRLVDGEGDGLPGFYLDALADRWLVSTTTGELEPALRAWLEEQGARGQTVYWKQLDQHDRTSPAHLAGPLQEGAFVITESGIQYRVDFQSGYSQGIFLDQRINRQRVRELSRAGDRVLNTFAYTGAFSVCAALGGATTTTLDLSQVYLDWARENFSLNDLKPEDHYFCKGDTFHWLGRFARQGRTFEGIILDPPTFSRDDKGKVFRVEQDYGRLVELASACLAPDGWMLCCTNCRKLELDAFMETVGQALPGARVSSQSMPEEYTGPAYLKSVWVRQAG